MLTDSQLQTLKADIAADPILSVIPNTPDGNFQIAQAYNAVADPQFVVWRTDVPTDDVIEGLVWTEYTSVAVGDKMAFELMIRNGKLNAANVNVRQGIQDIFAGPQQEGTRTNLIAIAKRDARRIEKLLAIGAGTEAEPATMTHEGTISYQDVSTARNLP